MLQIYMLLVKDSMIDVVKNVFNLILKYLMKYPKVLYDGVW